MSEKCTLYNVVHTLTFNQYITILWGEHVQRPNTETHIHTWAQTLMLSEREEKGLEEFAALAASTLYVETFDSH